VSRLEVIYDPLYLDWQLGKGHPTNPLRAKIATELLETLVPAADIRVRGTNVDSSASMTVAAGIARQIHDPDYVARVAAGDIRPEAAGVTPALGKTALAMFMGTVILALDIDAYGYRPGVSFNPQGAKHHAMRDRASGFCALNDMAWAAQWFTQQGKRVAYLDWDAHHGDGVEALTEDADAVVTYSIHQHGIFPGTGMRSHPLSGIYNRPLMTASGDAALHAGVLDALRVFSSTGCDVLLLAAGADGLRADPLTGLEYTTPGLAKAARMVGVWAAERGLPVLVGGAGGYRPYDETPVAWAAQVATLHQCFNPGSPLATLEGASGGMVAGLDY
jgi:acetoin utilization protein AcuC